MSAVADRYAALHVMVITAYSCLYTWILALERVPDQVAAFLIGLNLPLWVILLALDVIILTVGFFVDVAPAIILLTPVFMPALKALGVSPIQFGTILIVGMAIGLVTPPVGMCLNVASTITKLDIATIFRASIPFVIGNILILLLVTFVPEVSLWVPNLLMGAVTDISRRWCPRGRRQQFTREGLCAATGSWT